MDGPSACMFSLTTQLACGLEVPIAHLFLETLYRRLETVLAIKVSVERYPPSNLIIPTITVLFMLYFLFTYQLFITTCLGSKWITSFQAPSFRSSFLSVFAAIFLHCIYLKIIRNLHCISHWTTLPFALSNRLIIRFLQTCGFILIISHPSLLVLIPLSRRMDVFFASTGMSFAPSWVLTGYKAHHYLSSYFFELLSFLTSWRMMSSVLSFIPLKESYSSSTFTRIDPSSIFVMGITRGHLITSSLYLAHFCGSF